MNLKTKRQIRNLTYHLIKNGRIKTSVSHARVLKKRTERLISKASRDTVAARRYAARKLPPDGVERLFTEIGPACASRPGGYTRMLRIGRRQGDARQMCILEIIDV